MNNYQKNELTDDFSDFKSQALTPVYLQPDQYDFVNLLWAYAIFLRSQGKESIYAHLLTHNQAFGNPPLTTKQVGMINDIISSLFIKVNDNSLHSIATFWQADNDANIEKVDNPHHPKADLEAAKLLPKRIGDHSIAAYCMNFLPTLIIVNLAGKKSKMMAWYGCLWSDYSDDELHRLIKKTLCELPNKISDSELRKKMIKYVENSSKIQAVARSIKLEITQVAHDMLDHDPEILAVKNGKVDLRTGQFSLALKTDYLTISVGTDFIAGRGCPQFMEFINQIMEGNLKLIDFLQMLVGYCFLGENPERIIIFFLGAGRNGKSTLVNILMMLLGDYATAAPQKTLMGKNPDTLGDDLLALKGRRILTYNETDKNSKLSVGRLKSMSGNDHLIVRKPHAGEWHQIKTVGKMILSTNVLPIAEDDSDGFWDRLRIVPFNYRVPDGMVNPHIQKNIQEAELPGILNWALQGLMRYQRDPKAFQETREMLDLKNNYRNISQKNRNSLRMFLESFYEPDEKALTKSSDLMPDYNQWVKNTLNEPSNVITSYQELKRQMEDLAFAKYSNTNAQKGYFMKRKVSTD